MTARPEPTHKPLAAVFSDHTDRNPAKRPGTHPGFTDNHRPIRGAGSPYRTERGHVLCIRRRQKAGTCALAISGAVS
jgi:hypothetical protein